MRAEGRSFVAWVLALGVLIAPACTRARARTLPEAPPLDMPAPPPRDVEPIDVEPAAPPPGSDASRAAAPRPRPATPLPPPPARAEPQRPEPPKPEPAPTDPVRPSEEPRPPTTLQTAPATAETELSRTIRATLTRANTDLNRVDYRRLNADARQQYDTAKRFIRQADDAVRAKNLVFAKNLADKAASLAAQLAGQ